MANCYAAGEMEPPEGTTERWVWNTLSNSNSSPPSARISGYLSHSRQTAIT